MSRTRHRSKPSGYDYWSRRPGNKGGSHCIGKYQKRFTNKRERTINKRIVRLEVEK